MSESLSEGQQAPSIDENAQTPAVEIVPASGTEQPSTETVETIEPEPKKAPWQNKRIDELTREKHEERRQKESAQTELRNLQNRQPAPQQQQPQQRGMVPAAEVERLVEQRHQAQEFNNACNATYEAGIAKFTDFDDAVKTYEMLGGPPPAFLEAVTSLGKEEGAKVFYDLGKDPDEAKRIMGLPPVRMAMALAKMAAVAPKAIPVSKVPDPIRPVQGSNTRSDSEPDAKNDADWTKWFRKGQSR